MLLCSVSWLAFTLRKSRKKSDGHYHNYILRHFQMCARPQNLSGTAMKLDTVAYNYNTQPSKRPDHAAKRQNAFKSGRYETALSCPKGEHAA